MQPFEAKALDEVVGRRHDRRNFLKTVGAGALGLAGAGLLSPRAAAQEPNIDIAVLQFALNLEYLEAEFYAYATAGVGIARLDVNVSGPGEGSVTVKNNPKVRFRRRDVREFAEEIAQDEIRHVIFLRKTISDLGGTPVGRPNIDLRNSFNAAARAAGIGDSFDPFASDVNFLLGAFIFEDVGVTAYKGAARLLTNKDVLEAAAGILAVEAYHAGSLRNEIYQAGNAARIASRKISDLRDGADDLDGEASDKDQGVVREQGRANIVPADGDAIAFSRSVEEVLRIVYLGGATRGGFFPDGINSGGASGGGGGDNGGGVG